MSAPRAYATAEGKVKLVVFERPGLTKRLLEARTADRRRNNKVARASRKRNRA